MSGSGTTGGAGQTRVGTTRTGTRPGRRLAAVALGLALSACTSAPDPAAPGPQPSATSGQSTAAQPSSDSSPGTTSSAGPSGSASTGSGVGSASGSASGSATTDRPSAGPSTVESPPGDELIITVTESGRDVSPSGQKLDARVGQQVVLEVISDRDDVIHAHTGGDGYELEVSAGVPTTGTFTLDSAGSFEVESHELEKVIVVVNAR